MSKKAVVQPDQEANRLPDWEVVFSDSTTAPLQNMPQVDAAGKTSKVLSVTERQEQFIDLGLYHVRRLHAEHESKDAELRALKTENQELKAENQELKERLKQRANNQPK
ncbi:hypothetical protein PM082_004568 [Marasmius tenuissimus]|nr:hypothetical protein PM082_004568 [Marasmius tenuissimus]